MSAELLDRPRERAAPAGGSAPARLEMTVTTDIRPRVTFEELLALCALNREVNFEWDPDGTLTIMAPAGAGPGHKNALLTMRLGNWADADGTGLCFDSSAGFVLADGSMRNPDAAWVRRERWEALTADQRAKGFPPLVPDFVAELRSPSDGRAELQAKMSHYRNNGVRLGWLIDPVAGEVEVYRPDRPVEVLRDPRTLDGGDVLPGFVLTLQGILDDLGPRTA
jgi:Uma2 family endonuclease